MNEQTEVKNCSALCKYACGIETVDGEVLIRCSQGGIECIEAIKSAITGKPPYEAWLVGQIIKYLWRYNYKNGVQDVEKAQFYVNRLLEEVKHGES